MKNHKLKLILTAVFVLFNLNTLLAQQTETFDLINYNPPKEWVKDSATEGVVTFTTSNEKDGFCVIGIYSSREISGDVKTDFEAEWTNYVATPFETEIKPDISENPRDDGWKQISGGVIFNGEGGKTLAVLTVFIGGGKVASVIAVFNDDAYSKDVEEFMNTLTIRKPDSVDAHREPLR